MARPDVEMIRIKGEKGLAIFIHACRHFEFKVLMRDIFLLVIHSVCSRGWWRLWETKRKSTISPPEILKERMHTE